MFIQQEPIEFHIDEVFQVTEVGQVFGGMLKSGVLYQNAVMLLGPFDDGSFQSCSVSSIHRNKTPCKVVHAGQSAALHLAGFQGVVRRGMVLIPPECHDNLGCLFFQVSTVLTC